MNPHPFFLCLFPSQHTLSVLPSPRQRTWHAHLSHSLIQERINLFIAERDDIREIPSDSIIAIMGNRIKCELAGVVRSRTYSCFETLKVRDHRLEPVPHYRYYEDI